jgi:hypothetical protein
VLATLNGSRGRTGHWGTRWRSLLCLAVILGMAMGPPTVPPVTALTVKAAAARAVSGATGGQRPRPATSYYMKTVSTTVAQRRGCRIATGIKRGREPVEALVVLAFGRPRHPNGRYGASLFGVRFASTKAIRRAGVAFAKGFLRCALRRPGATLRLALGTSNYGSRVTWAHGRAWATMVNRANETLIHRGWAGRVSIVGAIDIELSWNGPKTTKAWVRGYDSANRWPYYNFGDAANCPPYGQCAGGWTMKDVWYVSWGALPAYALPQIYTGSGSMARQWFNIALYSYREQRSHMTIAGVMSQRGACRDSRDPCHGMNNSPSRAWTQLVGLLNRHPGTKQQPRFATDIRWHSR